MPRTRRLRSRTDEPVVGEQSTTIPPLESSLERLLKKRKIEELLVPLAKKRYTKYALWEAVNSEKYKDNLNELIVQFGIDPTSGTYWKVIKLFHDLQQEPDPILELEREPQTVVIVPASSTPSTTTTTTTAVVLEKRHVKEKVCHRCHHRYTGGHKAHGAGKCDPCQFLPDECPWEKHPGKSHPEERVESLKRVLAMLNSPTTKETVTEMLNHSLEKEPAHTATELQLRTAAVFKEHEARHTNDEVEKATYNLAKDELASYLTAHAGMDNYGPQTQSYVLRRLEFWKSLVPLL